jgi:type IV secretory pathway VirD2 relaxase
MLKRIPLAGEKDAWIERWLRNVPAAKDSGGRLHLPDRGKPAAVRRGRAWLPVAVSSYRRRVIVVQYHYRMRGDGYAKLHSHLNYVERPEAGERAVTPELFDERSDAVRGHSAIQGWRHDRHHFRIMLAPDDGAKLDMKAYTREYMAEMEKALGTKLQWMAGIHEKADAAHALNRHVHIILRGIDDRGGDLVMDREFIKHETRRIAEELATRHLGQMSQRELDAFQARQAERQREGREDQRENYRPKAREGLEHG